MRKFNMTVLGIHGRMGQTLGEHLKDHPTAKLYRGLGRHDDFAEALASNASDMDVVVDLSTPTRRMQHIHLALEHRVPVVTGVSGFTEQDVQQVSEWVSQFDTGCVIASNFLLGNVLMQLFAERAARYFAQAEILEYHHEKKIDAPSGTALRTAERMAAAQQEQQQRNHNPTFNQDHRTELEHLPASRGAEHNSGIRVHAVRMGGFLASQEVLLGAAGERLTIRHDCIDRKAYMAGIDLAVQHVLKHATCCNGLEDILHPLS